MFIALLYDGGRLKKLFLTKSIPMVIAHTSVPVSNYKKSKKFYTAVLGAIGYTQNMEYGEAAGFSDGENTDFWIGTNEKGVVPLHVAFAVKNKDAVQSFYDAALKAGGKDNGKPGYRKDYWPGYYAAFVHDLDGHNVEAVFYDYSQVK
ncbi:MAG TPA: VOC family protein [Candidatus Paceibacterota bacterium]|nr:VOC family protein [Candidatus Paceibacterota bacterium]